MPVHHLEPLFRPRSVAVVGASPSPTSVARTVLANLRDGGFRGPVHGVNPKYDSVVGLPCVARVGDLEEPPDLVVIATPAATVPGLVRECGEAGAGGILVLSAGFREIGQAGKELERAVQTELRAFHGLRMIGPNCLGLMSPHHRLNASFANVSPEKGRVAFLSQSGAICTAVLDWARGEGVGFSHFVSIGNTLDVQLGELIDYFAQDGHTDSLILYVESVAESRGFMSAARAFARQKPIIAYKAGRFAESARAAVSHTGAMAGVDAVYEAAFARAGIVRVYELEHMFGCAELLARPKVPEGPRLAIVTNAGGPGVMAVDALIERQGRLAELGADTLAELDRVLPAAWSHGNPVDVLGDAPPERLQRAVELVLADPNVDAVVALFAPQAMSAPTEAALGLASAAQHSPKPVLASWMGGESMAAGQRILNASGIPTYSTPEQAVRAFSFLIAYARTREVLTETPRELPVTFELDRAEVRERLQPIFRSGRELLLEDESKAILEAYGIPVAKPFVARSADEAVALAERIGYPVVVKVVSEQITHKTEVGGVVLNVATERELRETYAAVVERARAARPDADVEGVSVQAMIGHASGRELIVGAKRDPIFGAVLLVGAGGTAAEVLQDRALELPPLNERLARRMLESLRSWPLLNGYRGRPAVAVDALVDVLLRVSYLVADSPEIAELDVNPLLATPEGVIALDARVVLDRPSIEQPGRPYAHLAIRPYPDEYTRRERLPSGLEVVLRAIRPEDEPMWHVLLAACSPETLELRFRRPFEGSSHELAARFCMIDYDRELALVAEARIDGQRRLLGVGRLIADADRGTAEYAVLVGDEWQGTGLGSLLTDRTLAICAEWGIRRVVARYTSRNVRVSALFEHRGFTLERPPGSDLIVASKDLV